MSFRTPFFVTVCSAFLAASAAVSGTFAAANETELVSAAYRALQSGNAELAIADYTRAIDSRGLAPDLLANALLNRGLAYQRMNEHEFAIDDYTAALRIDAMSGTVRALALYNRGLSYQRLSRTNLAMEDFTSALFLDGQFSHAYFSRGSLLRDTGQFLFALADFDKALRYKYPDPARVYVAESIVFEKLNRPSDARNALMKALESNPSYEPALRRLAVLDGLPAPVVAGDAIQTAGISQTDEVLPAARAPSSELLIEAPSAGGKQFTDRVLPDQQSASASSPAAVAEETVLAVETVPVDAPEAAAAPQETVQVAVAEVEVSAEAQQPAAVSTAPAASPVRGWAVQIASATSEDAAWSSWKKMQSRFRVLDGKEPVVVRADLGSKGIFYRVRLVGFDNQADAGRECSLLKSKGVKCYVSKASS